MYRQILIIGSLVLWVSSGQAAFLFDIRLGYAAWYTVPTGNTSFVGGNNAVDEALNLEAELEDHLFAELQHPIPIIPDIRVQYTRLKIDGNDGQLTSPYGDLQVDDVVDARLELEAFDVILFYTLPLPSIDIDLGLHGRYLDGLMNVQEQETDTPIVVDEPFTLPIPMGYGRVHLNLPLTPLFLEAQASGLAIAGNTVFDGQVMLGYESDLGLGIAGGWRHQVLRLDEVVSDMEIDVEIGGPFATVFFHF